MKYLSFLRDPQFHQTLILMIILNVGINIFNLYFDYTKFALVFGSALIFDTVLYRSIVGKWRFSFSSINVGFGISFFLRTDLLWLYPLAAFLGIASKYFFRVQSKHFFNPSNFAVVLILVLFPYVAWVNPLQWGNPDAQASIAWAYLIIFAFGIYIFSMVRRYMNIDLLYIMLSFIGVHFLIYFTFTQEASILSIVSGNTHSFLSFYNPSFWVFAFYMITDPVTLVKNKLSMVFFGASIALGFYILQYYINENYSLLISLFLMTLFIPLIRYFDKKKLYKKLTIGNVILIGMFSFAFVYFLYTMESKGKADLAFDNRCGKLICNDSWTPYSQ